MHWWVAHPLHAEPVDGGRQVAAVGQVHDQAQMLLRKEDLLQKPSKGKYAHWSVNQAWTVGKRSFRCRKVQSAQPCLSNMSGIANGSAIRRHLGSALAGRHPPHKRGADSPAFSRQ